MKRAKIIKGVIEDVWYGIQWEDENGKWNVETPIGDDTKKEARRQMYKVAFWGHRVQMVEHFHGYRPVGNIKDFRNR